MTLLAISSARVEGALWLARPLLSLLFVLAAAALWRVDRQQSRRAREAALQGDAAADVAPVQPLWRRRAVERAGLVQASLMTFVLSAISVLQAPPGQASWNGPLTLVAFFWAAHLAFVVRDHRGDPLLLPVCLLLVGPAWIEIARLQPALAAQQVVWVGVALIAMTVVALLWRDYRRAEDFKYLVLVGALLLQVAVMTFGTEVNGARLWIRFGGWLQFQPVEIVKVLLIVFLAAYLRQNRLVLSLGFGGEERRLALRYLVPLLVVAGGAEAVFVIQRDLGQGLLFFGVFLSMYYAATRRLGVVLLALLGFLGLSYLCWRTFGHVRVRFENWLDPWRSPDAEGFQMVQAMYALASGGWFGSGLWRGQPWRVPEASTDFIFVSLVEELGSVAAVALLAAFSLLVARAVRIAREARDDFGAFLACGVGAVLGIQAFVIVAGTIRMIPMTGITLPFMSYGGTSLVVNFVMVGMLLEISAGARRGRNEAEAGREGLRPLSIFHVVFLLVPALFLAGFQLQLGDALARDPANPRTRPDLRARGKIVDRRGEKLAWTTGAAGRVPAPPWVERALPPERRAVAGAAFGNLVGYCSAHLGEAGLEQWLHGSLQGAETPIGLTDALGLALGRPPLRHARLAVDGALQRASFEALQGRRGAVVILDPRSGDLLALASSPGFDADRVERDWAHLRIDADAPLLNRALHGLYPPGSVLKPAIVALGIEQGVLRPEEVFTCDGAIEVNGHRLHDAHGAAHGRIDVTDAVASSCNVTLARIAERLGTGGLCEGLLGFGFGQSSPLDVPSASGDVPAPAAVTPQMRAQMGFGQGPLLVTPLQVALMTAAFARHGAIVLPRVVRAWEPDSVSPTDGTTWRTPISASAADAVAAMMEAAVSRGTAAPAGVAGVRVAGKTGTAENPHGLPHAWFAGFAPAEAPRVVVVVLVENAGWGGEVAAPLAGRLIEAALRRTDDATSQE